MSDATPTQVDIGAYVDEGATLASERVFNERYVEHCEDRNDKVVRGDFNSPRSRLTANTRSTPLVGRVAFVTADPSLGSDFYVGPRFAELEGQTVVSWNAPASAAFYVGTSNQLPEVGCRRTFASRGDDLIALADDPTPGLASRKWFTDHLEPITVPAPPKRSSVVVDLRSNDAEDPVIDVTGPNDTSTEIETLRAREAVMATIQQPKGGRMRSVLSTLQRDQYKAVSAQHDKLLIVEGGPGTGKSIVAAHRAAWLTLPTEVGKGPRLGEVLLLGPTQNYVDHVKPALEQLGVHGAGGPSRVGLYSVTELVRQFSDHKSLPPAQHPDPFDVSWDLWSVCRQLARKIKHPAGSSPQNRIRRVIDALQDERLRADVCRSVGREAEVWLAAVPSYERASSDSRYALFFAALNLNLSPPRRDMQYEHIVVDEAQDLRPIDWMLADALLAEGGKMTLLGDLHQRRSDNTASSWDEIAKRLELSDDDEEFRTLQLAISYRTTREILRFAGRLLPRGERSIPGLMSGRSPDLTGMGVASSRLAARMALEALDSELGGSGAGSAAIITSDPKEMHDQLRRFGWAGSGAGRWVRNGHDIHVLDVEQARGLEFDLVVVHEPGGIETNLGRHGPLFTALTRASKMLVLTGSKPLPRELRGA